MRLGEKLRNLIKKIIRSKRIDETEISSLLKELKIALLEADVDLKIVENLIKEIEKEIRKEKIPPGLTLREYLIKLIYDKLVEILGKEKHSLIGKKKIMLIGLFGSGKTTTAAKLAYYFQKRGLKVLLVGLDYHRPAAPEQLEQLAEKVGVKVLIDKKSKDPYKIAKESLKIGEKFDVIIYDTAGRDALDKELANELRRIGGILRPDEVLLVIPADIGKIAGKQAQEFDKLVKITGVIVTKLDGTAKGGGALAACSVTKSKVKFIGTGEKIEDLEEYDPRRFVSRILGLGDLESLLEKAREVIKEEEAKKIVKGEFSLEEFLEQLKAIQKMGPLSSILRMIPGFGVAFDLPEDLISLQEEKLKKYRAIIQSMTIEERRNPEIINASRIKRIARGSGTSEQDVRELLSNYKKMVKLMKIFSKTREKDLFRMLKKFGAGFSFKF